MSKVRVHSFTISLDGYGAGPHQSIETPLGVGGEALHGWMVRTRTFERMMGRSGDAGTTGVDDDIVARHFDNVGACIMGRNMFAPSRGAWRDGTWKGWWGDNPPYHTPVFVLTHHRRAPLEMDGGTTFHFVTDGIQTALDRAKKAAGSKDVLIVGGASIIRQYLAARLIDEMHVVVSPMLLGSGEPLYAGADLPALGYSVASHVATPDATHYVFRR